MVQQPRCRRISEERKDAEIEGELDRIRAAAQTQYVKQDVQGDGSAGRRGVQLAQQEEYEMARSLHGDYLAGNPRTEGEGQQSRGI